MDFARKICLCTSDIDNIDLLFYLISMPYDQRGSTLLAVMTDELKQHSYCFLVILSQSHVK